MKDTLVKVMLKNISVKVVQKDMQVKNINKFLCLAVFCVVLLGGCVSELAVSSPQNYTNNYLLMNMGLFSIEGDAQENKLRRWFFRDYLNTDFEVRTHSGVYLSSKEYLAAHLFAGPDTSQGTVIFIHGYHGTSKNSHFVYWAKELMAKGFRIIVLNLPGHEFSGGYRITVKDHNMYRIMLSDFLLYTKGQLGNKIMIVGHSVGATTIYDSYYHFQELMSQVSATVLLAPFSDLNYRGVYKMGARLVPQLINKNAGTMEDYTRPTSWIYKANNWIKEMAGYSEITQPNMFIVFGLEDKVIKTKKSIEYYTAHVKQATIKEYKGQDHVLLKVADDKTDSYDSMRADVLDWLLMH